MAMKCRTFNPTNDLLFKFVFGREERKHITLQFINDITACEGREPFTDIQFRNTELTPEKQEDKLGRLDVFGITEDGTRVDIEMQVINYPLMEKRVLFYWANMYIHFDALQAGDSYVSLKPAIVISILRYNFLPQDDPHSLYVLYNPKTGHQLTDDIELHFLEIPKYRNKNIAEMSRIERWLAYFANSLDDNEKEELAMNEPAIRDAFDAAKRFIMDDKTYQEYVNREMAILDYNTAVKASREEGRAEAENRISALNLALVRQKRYDDIEKAAQDNAYRQMLYQELHI